MKSENNSLHCRLYGGQGRIRTLSTLLKERNANASCRSIVPDQLGRSIVSGVPPRSPFYVAKPIDAAAIKASIERALKTQAGRDGVSETVADIGGLARLGRRVK
jgi:hypothetical protein